MLESKPKCERSELPASEASHPRERSDREPPAGLASRPGAAGAKGRIASKLNNYVGMHEVLFRQIVGGYH